MARCGLHVLPDDDNHQQQHHHHRHYHHGAAFWGTLSPFDGAANIQRTKGHQRAGVLPVRWERSGRVLQQLQLVEVVVGGGVLEVWVHFLSASAAASMLVSWAASRLNKVFYVFPVNLTYNLPPVPLHSVQGRPRSRTQNGAQGQEQQPLSRSSFPGNGIRLSREMNEMMLNPVDGCQVEFVGDDTHHWLATILGPSDTPYEGGHTQLDILFPENYPVGPPKVQFLTQMYHCNICGDGLLYRDILSNNWTPVLTVEKVLLSIRTLLAAPNPDDPLEILVANMYKADHAQHDEIAREWTTRYATPEAF
ncbi:constitutive photomorphogenesis protein 10-like [Drosophila obscura]|uniref:constitutive photomorphogenesis protein 10-like n=1 Tax=Drosophila obscura TaxID=7282 RepID=UPI001BB263C5|nr:constitutive photomorphogenesis protein 10-like [Drosophila obscura]